MSGTSTPAQYFRQMREVAHDIVLTPSISPMQGKESTVKCIIDCQVVLSRVPEGPLASHIGPFARSLSKQGYSLYSIHHQVWLAACLSRWLKQQGVGLRSITSDHPPRYLRYRARHALPSQGDAAALKHVLEFLRSEGVIPAKKM